MYYRSNCTRGIAPGPAQIRIEIAVPASSGASHNSQLSPRVVLQQQQQQQQRATASFADTDSEIGKGFIYYLQFLTKAYIHYHKDSRMGGDGGVIASNRRYVSSTKFLPALLHSFIRLDPPASTKTDTTYNIFLSFFLFSFLFLIRRTDAWSRDR